MAGSYEELSISHQSSRGCSFLSLDTLQGESTVVENEEKLFPDKAGGFSFTVQSKVTRNRRIIWKVAENVIELTESSLDYNLFGNKLLITIPGQIILPNVVIHESEEDLTLFFATTKSVHQISLAHPNHEKYGFILPTGMNVSLPSVFNDAEIKYKSNRVKQFAVPQCCNAFDVTVTQTGDAYFGLVTDARTLLVVMLDDIPELCSCIELKEASMMHRIWTGLVPSFVRGNSSWMGVESLLMHSFNEDHVYAVTLCKDLKIRVWDVQTQSCITTKDLASFIPDKLDSQADTGKEVGCLTLKKAHCPSSRQLILAAHCCLTYSSQFIILEVFKELRDIVLMHVSNFFSEFNNIQDIYLTSQYVWALWSTSDGEHSVSYAPIEGGKDFERGWHVVHVRMPEKEEVFIPMFQDAKEVYLEHLFTPGIFHKQSIIKALQVFTKTIDLGAEFLPDEAGNMTAVKESVLQILHLEIDRNTINRELNPTEYQDLQHQCWSRFFSFVRQCSQTRETPLGLYVDDSCVSPFIIRQDTCGYLHYLDWLDHLYLTDLDVCEGISSYIANELDLDDDEVLSQDILYIIECLKTIPEQFNHEVILGIDKDLHGNEDVKTFLTSMASVLVTNSSDFEQLVGDPVHRGDYLCTMETRLKHIRNPLKAVETIISAMEITGFTSSTTLDQSDMDELPTQSATQFLGSKDGVHLITEMLTTMTLHRMHLCRDLYVLLKLMDKISCKIGLSLDVAKEFSTPISSTCYEMLRSYHAVYWSAKKTFEEIDPTTLDTNLTNLAALQLTERSPASKTARKISEEDTDEPLSLLFCFIRDVGIQNSLRYLTETNLNSMKPGDYSTLEMTKLIAHACLNEIWVLNETGSDFSEYLAAHCQYCHLNEYLHLCDEWCMVNRGTKDFLIAQSYLGSDQPHKALKYFISAARGISVQEPLLMNLLEGDEESKQESLVHYFIKVMRLFEQFEYPNFVISSASSAITIAKKHDPSVPMLWSVIFKNHMELRHYNEAYASIIHNTDRIRRHDCLRYFVIALCERGLFQEICSYPYVNLEEEVVNIIELRARTIDITVNKYYDLLYSYHIMKNDYRKAATTMYEQACRLCTEMHGLKSLQKQAKCFLASITSLKLVDIKYSWIVRPQEKPNSVATSQHYSQSPKRKESGEEVYRSAFKKKKHHKTVIVEMNDLEKEYMLVLARLKLVQHGKNDSFAVGPSLSPAETIGLLSQTGLFDTSFSLAQKFKLPLKNIFEALAGKCASLVHNKVSEFDDRWKWLNLNEINTTQLVSSKSASQQAFYLLQTYLDKFKSQNHSTHLKAVTSKFLSMGCNLPSWIVKDYEYVNPAELLHLYMCYDMVTEATLLSIKYIDTVLGKGKEYLGLNTALHATTAAVWLPYTSFDQLLTALRSNFENEETAQMCEELQDKLNDYFTKVEKTSCDKIHYTQQLHSRLITG